MNVLKSLLIALLVVAITPATAQTADEVIANYIEKTGGAEAWNTLDGTRISASITTQGMEIPLDIYRFKDGRQLVKIDLMGQEMTQLAFDGETLWGTNPMTMEVTKGDAATVENMKSQITDFPSPFLNYKEKGFTAELMGKETIEGTDVYKVKLTQKPLTVEGKEVPVVTYTYFDTNTYYPIVSETDVNGEMKRTTRGDYKEVDGLFFPFTMGMMGQNVQVKEITVNPTLDPSAFTMPE